MRMYRITTLTLQGVQLTFTVDKYEIEEGKFIKFTDRKTKQVKLFHASRCEITEVEERPWY